MSDEMMDFDETPTEKYPLDVEKLSKGDDVPVEVCENILGVSREHRHYSFKLLALRDRIEQAAEDLGIFVNLRIRYEGLHVNTDEEDVSYQESRARSGVRAIAKAQRARSKIDHTALTDETRQKLLDQTCRWGARLAAIRSAGKEKPMELPEPEPKPENQPPEQKEG